MAGGVLAGGVLVVAAFFTAAFRSWQRFLRRRLGCGGVFTAVYWSAVFFSAVFHLDLLQGGS